MQYFPAIKLVFAGGFRSIILFTLLGFSTPAQGQNVFSGSQTGTLQAMHQGDGYLTISGRDYGFHNDVSLVFYKGVEVGDNFLNEGLVVRFVLDNDGMLARIEILGPLDLIEALEES